MERKSELGFNPGNFIGGREKMASCQGFQTDTLPVAHVCPQLTSEDTALSIWRPAEEGAHAASDLSHVCP